MLFFSTWFLHKMTGKWDEDLVSVIMPVYKTEKGLLSQSIKSILDQDYENLELIIVEDPSSCLANPIIKNFNDPRICYFINETKTSFAYQLNLGLAKSRGEFVARMDADDISEPTRIGLQYKFMKQHSEVSVVGTNLKIISGSNKEIGLRLYPETSIRIASRMRLENAMAHPSVMCRKKDILNCGGFDPAFGMVADYDLWCRMILAGENFYNLQQPLLRYRVHAQASKVTSLKKTIRATLAIKRRHFKGKKGLWGSKEALRYQLEKFLLFLPPRLVLKMFIILSFKR
jgi:glycosyltransferase involved in cell wall biosynthesis